MVYARASTRFATMRGRGRWKPQGWPGKAGKMRGGTAKLSEKMWALFVGVAPLERRRMFKIGVR